MHKHAKSRTRRRLVAGVGAVSLTLFGLVGLSAPAFSSVSGDSGFEVADGNLAPDGAFDWNSFAPTTWTGTEPYRTTEKTVGGWKLTGLEDAQATTSDTAFAGGTKQDDDCASVKDGKAPNKDDLKRVYVSSNTVNGDVFLTLAWVRIPQNTTSPSAHIGFEFNQGDTACGSGSDGLVERTTGDMLIVYDFEGGSTDTPTITLRRWIDSGSCEVGSDSPPCWGTSTNLTQLGFAEAKVNTSTVGEVSDQIAPSPPQTLGLNEFGEAGINLTDAGVFGTNVCTAFGKTYAVSRSSGNSATAQMKDLVGPGDIDISNCGNVIIHKVTEPTPDPTDTTFTYTTTGGLDPDGFSLKDGDTQDYGSTVFAGGYTVSEDDPSSANFDLSALSCDDSDTSHGSTYETDLDARTVSFDLKALDTIECTFTNTLQQGALRIQKLSTKSDSYVTNSGAVFSVDGPDTPEGEDAADFQVVDNGGADDTTTPVTVADETGDDSGTQVEEGVGEICVSGLVPGDYTVDETTPPDGYADASGDPVVVTVVNGTDCGENLPDPEETGFTAVGVFTNAPLADVQVNFRDGGSGETSLQGAIECVDADETATLPSGDTTTAEGWDDTLTVPGIPVDPSPRTLVCTIVIDP